MGREPPQLSLSHPDAFTPSADPVVRACRAPLPPIRTRCTDESPVITLCLALALQVPAPRRQTQDATRDLQDRRATEQP